MHATGSEDVDALFSGADGKFEVSVEHDGGVAAGDFDSDGTRAFLHEGARPQKKVSVCPFFGRLPRKGIDLLDFAGFDLLDQIDNLFPGIVLSQVLGGRFVNAEVHPGLRKF